MRYRFFFFVTLATSDNCRIPLPLLLFPITSGCCTLHHTLCIRSASNTPRWEKLPCCESWRADSSVPQAILSERSNLRTNRILWINPRWWSGWLPHQSRENTCPHPAGRQTELKWQLPEGLTHAGPLSPVPGSHAGGMPGLQGCRPGHSGIWGWMRAGFGDGCGAGAVTNTGPGSSAAPGRAAARARGDLCLSELLPSSFLSSRCEPRCRGEGSPAWVFLLHHRHPGLTEAPGTRPRAGCGRPAGLCEGWAAPAVTDHRWPSLTVTDHRWPSLAAAPSGLGTSPTPACKGLTSEDAAS